MKLLQDVVDPRFSKIDDKTYQSPDCDGAANKVEITVNSGAGSVEVNTKWNPDCNLSGIKNKRRCYYG